MTQVDVVVAGITHQGGMEKYLLSGENNEEYETNVKRYL